MSEQKTGRPADTDGETPTPPGPWGRFHARVHANPAISLTWKILVTTVGTLIVIAGIIMFVTPGPALVLIPLGLAILATEWAWAERLLQKAKNQARKAKEKSDAMDPKVRRRRMILTGLAVLVTVGAVTAYVLTYGWPSLAVDGWDWMQGIAGWLPELPGPKAASLDG